MENIITTLKNLITEHGMEILEQEQRLKAILADLHPNEKRFRYLFELSFRAEIPRKLIALQNEGKSAWEEQVNTIKHYFKEEYFLEDNAVNSVFDCWRELLEEQEHTITDIDGNVYHIVKIGMQEWLVENLKTTRFQNGDLIETTTPATKDIRGEFQPKYQWPYDGDEYNALIFGRLYTGYVVADKRNIAPLGWRVATGHDWNKLEEYLISKGIINDGTTSKNGIDNTKVAENESSNIGAINKLLAASLIGAIGNDLSNNNISGFTALLGGYRDEGGRFCYVGLNGFWWSSSLRIEDGFVYRSIYPRYYDLCGHFPNRVIGFSVRCIKDI